MVIGRSMILCWALALSTGFRAMATTAQETQNGVVTIGVEPFIIGGSTIEELRENIRRRAGKEDMKGATGTTRISFVPEVVYEERNHTCRIERAAINLNVTMALPSWNRPEGVGTRADRAWSNFIAYIEAHEQRHVEIAREYRERMVKAVQALTPTATCERLRDGVAATMQAVARQHDAEQRGFDDRERARSSKMADR